MITTSGSPVSANFPAVAVGGSPFGAAITPDGSLALILNIVDGTMSPIDLTARPPRPLPTVDIGGRGDAFIAITPDGRLALVADTGSSDVYPVVIEGHTFRVGRAIDVGKSPGGIAITSDGSTAWVVMTAQGSIRPIDLRGTCFIVGPPIAVGAHPGAIALSPDGTSAYVVRSASNSVTAVPLLAGGSTSRIAVGQTPAGAVITPDGSTMYVTNGGSGSVTPIDIAVHPPVAGGPFVLPHGLPTPAPFRVLQRSRQTAKNCGSLTGAFSAVPQSSPVTPRPSTTFARRCTPSRYAPL